jgi:hypothetical protein
VSKDPESVPFVRRVLQISQTDERWFTLTRNATVVDRYSYISLFTRARQVLFSPVLCFLCLYPQTFTSSGRGSINTVSIITGNLRHSYLYARSAGQPQLVPRFALYKSASLTYAAMPIMRKSSGIFRIVSRSRSLISSLNSA